MNVAVSETGKDLAKGAGLLAALFASMSLFAVAITVDQTSRGCILNETDQTGVAYNPMIYAPMKLNEAVKGLEIGKDCYPGWTMR